MTELNKKDLLKVCARLLLIQSAWTAGSMQSEGFVYCITPALKKLFPEPKKLQRIVKHYKTPINTHPFLAGVLAGALLKMEVQDKSTKAILSYIKTTMGPLAALGDPFFHTGLAPLAAVIASIVALIFGSLWGIVAIILVFNIIHIFIRVSGVFIGYKKGEQALSNIGKWINPAKTRLVKTISGATSGILVGLIVVRYTPQDLLAIVLPVLGVCTVGLSLLLNKKRSLWIYVMPTFLLSVLALEVIL